MLAWWRGTSVRKTALHQAVSAGDVELAEVLLGLGADAGIKDARFDSTPPGWAQHLGQREMIDLQRRVAGEGGAAAVYG